MYEFTLVTGYHRNVAIRLLSRGYKKGSGRWRGRASQYGAEVVAALKKPWEASDRMYPRRLQPFLPELVQMVERPGELRVPAEVREQLCQMSAATIDRVLGPR